MFESSPAMNWIPERGIFDWRVFFRDEEISYPDLNQRATTILFFSESAIDPGLPALHRFIELLPFFAEICLATTIVRVYIL
jgi:hypothetical protein